TLSAYLETNAGRHAGLENCVPIVTQAAQRFAARDYTEAFNLIWLAYHTIETIRATDPQIPPLRGSGQAPADQTSSSVHCIGRHIMTAMSDDTGSASRSKRRKAPSA